MAKFRIKRISKCQYIIQKKFLFWWYDYFLDYPEHYFPLWKAKDLMEDIKLGKLPDKKSATIIEECEI